MSDAPVDMSFAMNAIALWQVAALGLAGCVVLAVLTWLASVRVHDVSIVDRVWSLFQVVCVAIYAVALPAQEGARRAWLIALVLLWALRLAAHITWRNWGHGEDARYQTIRARNEPNFSLKSLWLVFLLQAVLGWVVSAPLLAALAGTHAFNGWDVLGVALAGFGIVFEALADWQLTRFKADPAHKGQVMDQGLWRWSRHPNYFGECCTWWGIGLLAWAAAGSLAWWSVVSPLMMTFLLLKVSGVTLLEQGLVERRPAYRDYIARTSAFIPWPPRGSA